MLAAWSAATWGILEESGVWLLLGFFIGGLLHQFLPKNFIERHLGTPGPIATLKAAAIGMPLPLCSCSVIPVGIAIRRHGASRGATASFLISTPESGIESFLLSSALLGLPLTLYRIMTAFVSAFAVGILIDAVPEKAVVTAPPETSKSCCAPEPIAHCCDASAPPRSPFLSALRYAFVDLVDDVAVSLTAGILLAGLLSVLVPNTFYADAGLGAAATMLAVLVLSLPLYICASASTPLAAVMFAKGLPPGAVIVFLLAGPATNFATMLVVRDQLGQRALMIYLAGIITGAIAFGALANRFITAPIPTSAVSGAHDHMHANPLMTVCAAIFCLLVVWRLVVRITRRGGSSV